MTSQTVSPALGIICNNTNLAQLVYEHLRNAELADCAIYCDDSRAIKVASELAGLTKDERSEIFIAVGVSSF